MKLSTNLPRSPPCFLRKHHDMHWTVELDSGKRYLAVRALGGAGVITRATHVWVVVPYISPLRTAPTSGEGCSYYPAKGSETYKTEGIEPNEDEMPREMGGTSDSIRQGSGDNTSDEESNDANIELLLEGAADLFPQVQTRPLQSPFIWPLNCFKFGTIGELLRVFRDTIAAHKYLYENGVLHGDIRPENIYVVKRNPAPGMTDVASFAGCLIDLDHAKARCPNDPPVEIPNAQRRRRALDLPDDLVRTHRSSIALDVMDALKGIVDIADLDISPDIVRHANSLDLNLGRSMEYAEQAIIHSIKFGHLPENGVYFPMDLSWNTIKKQYDYQDVTNQPGSLSSARLSSFSSHEILFDHSFGEHYIGQVYHDAVHDLESFFWVLVHICLTNGGPGSALRDELTLDFSELDSRGCATKRQLQTLMQDVFEFEQPLPHFGDGKRRLLVSESSEKFEASVIGNFHPYFDSFKRLVLEWRSLLHLTYLFRGYEYHAIHDRVLEILDSIQMNLTGGNAPNLEERARI